MSALLALLRALFLRRPPFDPAQPLSHVFVVVDAKVDPAELARIAPGLQAQLREDFAPEWNPAAAGDVVRAGGAPQPGEVEIQLHDDAPPDEQGALAIHDKKPDGTPIIHAYVGLAARCGVSLSSCVSHELLEARADPEIDQVMTLPDGRVAAVEIADQVESIVYLKLGVEVSDFNLKANYGPAKAGVKYDFLGKQPKPFEVLEGGYAQVLDPNRGWIQLGTGMRAYRAELARLGLSRGTRRARRP